MIKRDEFYKFDIRTLNKKLEKGEITKEEYDEFLKSLAEADGYQEIDENRILCDAGIKNAEEEMEEEGSVSEEEE